MGALEGITLMFEVCSLPACCPVIDEGASILSCVRVEDNKHLFSCGIETKIVTDLMKYGLCGERAVKIPPFGDLFPYVYEGSLFYVVR